MDATTAIAIGSAAVAAVAAVVALVGVGVAFFAQRHASRSADGSLQSAAAAENTAKAATQQANILQEQWKDQKDDAKPNVEARVTSATRSRPSVGSPKKVSRSKICVMVNLQNLSTRNNIVESVSVAFRRETYNSTPATPVTLTTETQIPTVIEGGAICYLELSFDALQEVADEAHEKATVTVDCMYGGKRETPFYIFPQE